MSIKRRDKCEPQANAASNNHGKSKQQSASIGDSFHEETENTADALDLVIIQASEKTFLIADL